MSPYQYRCGRCRASTRPATTRAEAEELRADHRRCVHGGLIPDDEQLLRTDTEPGEYGRSVSTRAVLTGLCLLALASLITRALGR